MTFFPISPQRTTRFRQSARFPLSTGDDRSRQSSRQCFPKLRSKLAIAVLLCGVLAAASGCSKEKLKEALDDAKTKTKALTESTVQAIEEKLPARGSLVLETTPATAPIKQLDLELIAIGDGRPNVLQIVTYSTESSNHSFPAVMFHGTTDVGTATSLVGETIACDMYYQANANAQLAMTKPGETVSVTFESYDEEDGSLSISISAGELLDSMDQTISVSGGQAAAIVRTTGER